MAEKTLQQIVDEYVERGVARSEILMGLDRLERGLPLDDPNGPPRTSRGRILCFDKPGCLRELDFMHNNQMSPTGNVVSYGWYPYATLMKQKAQNAWEHHRDSRLLPKNTPPTVRFAKEIARWRAKEIVLERESRALHKRVRELEEKEQKEQKIRKKLGVIKLKEGAPYMADGRLLELKEGVYYVQGTDQSLDDYLTEVKLERAKFLERKRRQSATATT